MKMSQLKTSEQIAAAEMSDPQVAAELERTSVAEQLALWLTRYRADDLHAWINAHHDHDHPNSA